MPFLDKLLTGHTITDEAIYRTNSTALALNHATIRTTASTVVRTAKAGGGTLLVLNTDYTISEADTALGTEAGVAVYRKIAIINGTYQNVKLYVSYKTCGDYVNAEMQWYPGDSIEWLSATIRPGRWLWQNGQAVDREVYADLFAVIGTTYGVGNGTTTFNVPDRRESSPYGAGTQAAVTGTTHGAITTHDALALGAFADDRAQAHKHYNSLFPSGASGNPGSIPALLSGNRGNAVENDSTAITAYDGQMKADGANGTPRTGTTTRGKIFGVNYLIRY